ncbi:hypothetical protein [Paenibacillus mesotrionivorans]|uniref:Uncharacterized protein n=1 Tax=Paenibacillus mesotrionivorans TaxID=3160968 RepID=A0ACC7P4J6_9BACL
MRSTFCTDVQETLGVEVEKGGFKITPRRISKDGYCIYVKRRSEHVAYYIRCTDNRSKGGNVTVDLYISPIEFPSDRLDLIHVGVKFEIYSQYEVNDEVMIAAGRRVLAIIEQSGQLADWIEQQLDVPFIETGRTPYYLYSRRMYEKICRTPEVSASFHALQALARKCVKGRLSLERLNAACTQFSIELGEDFFAEFHPTIDEERKGYELANRLYGEAVFE